MSFALNLGFDERIVVILKTLTINICLIPFLLSYSVFLAFLQFCFIFNKCQFLRNRGECFSCRPKPLNFTCKVLLILLIQRIQNVFFIFSLVFIFMDLYRRLLILIVLDLSLLDLQIRYFRAIQIFVDLIDNV